MLPHCLKRLHVVSRPSRHTGLDPRQRSPAACSTARPSPSRHLRLIRHVQHVQLHQPLRLLRGPESQWRQTNAERLKHLDVVSIPVDGISSGVEREQLLTLWLGQHGNACDIAHAHVPGLHIA